MEERELTLERGEDLRWTVVGEDERAQLGETRQRILSLLESAAEPLAARRPQLASPSRSRARPSICSKMAEDRQVERVSLAKYRALPAREVA